jgi:hypothetical protein
LRVHCNSFARKTIKWWKKLFVHLFNPVVVNAHILHNKSSKEELSLKDCSIVPVWKFKRKVRLAVQLADLWGETIFYIEFQRHMLGWRENLSSHVACLCVCVCMCMCAERSKTQTGKTVKKCTTMYCRKCDIGLRIGQCFEVYHLKLNY